MAALIAVGLGAARLGRLPIAGAIPWAAVRAGLQLLAVSFVVGIALRDPWLALGFTSLMFLIGTLTTAQRTGLTDAKGRLAAGLAMLAGVVPVLAIVFASGAAPLNGAAIVPIGGIVVGAMMSAHTLVGRRAFADLRTDRGEYEAYLSLGFAPGYAVSAVVSPNLHESLIPGLDQTRTVGLVTLPGAYVGVLLGGGSPWDAGAAQVLVLVGITTGQTLTVLTARRLMAAGWLLPPELRDGLRPR
ncbi:MAG TPA: ABC transporter permease [Arachnia sp.]|nr:ABC transporter permease [Arachnia sp.]HMT87828.1 ABC transporter permease [Arachnia sp.]